MPRARPLDAAIRAIDTHGVLLVYPVANRPEPLSLWSVLHPRAEMRWAWDASGDDRVVALWHLREELARSRRVVYAKWLQRRATFFSRSVFRAMLRELHGAAPPQRGLSRDALALLELLEEDSPRSTKQLRKDAGLEGRMLERTYTGALDELWSRLLLVGVGEVADGAFPSLAIAATRLFFEDLWTEAFDPAFPQRDADAARLEACLTASKPLRRAFDKARARLDVPLE